MPFRKQVFEREVNRNMREGEDGPAPKESLDDNLDIKKSPEAISSVDDIELSEKKGDPPRFSTLFETASTLPFHDTSPTPKRKSGVYISRPWFVLLVGILFFESTLLFAYTVIGLYNNLPSRLLAVGGTPAVPFGSCNCVDRQPAINIAPNFVMPGMQGPFRSNLINAVPAQVISMTSTTSNSISSTTLSSTSSSTSSSTISSTTTTSQSLDTAAASALLGLLGGLSSSSDGGVQTSVVMVTVDPKPTPRPTVTSIKVVPGPTITAKNKRANVDSAGVEGDSIFAPESIPTSSTFLTLAIPTESE